ncbi:MAG: glycosyltransferase [Dysgonamonadaceae bacterium]|jgi:glycosyltransferase involved in cell wall biosynthesis|nr:glycosyltransferase [Dysgonamonadaceae bacterium]
MFSICIPVYNYDVRELVQSLHRQAMRSGLPFEILLMDDASKEEYRTVNSAIDWPYLRYIQLTGNAGRSKIRNRLAQAAKYTYLIFMDCDSAVSSETYIDNYIPYCKPNIVCYGGRLYEEKWPHDTKYLRWKYGVKRESIPAEEREKEPNLSFMTCNFLIDKALLEKIPFDETVQGYGHEDTLFGIQLLYLGIRIQHIDNPLIHLGLEDAAVFIAKTENAVANLRRIDAILQEKCPEPVNHSLLIRTEQRLKKWGLLPLTAAIFTVFKPLLKRNLLSKKPSLFLFDLYKLGTLCRLSCVS